MKTEVFRTKTALKRALHGTIPFVPIDGSQPVPGAMPAMTQVSQAEALRIFGHAITPNSVRNAVAVEYRFTQRTTGRTTVHLRFVRV